MPTAMGRGSMVSSPSSRVMPTSGEDELGGVGTRRISPPVLSGAFGKVLMRRVIRSGYCFQVYLPSSTVSFTAEAPNGGGSGVSIGRAWLLDLVEEARPQQPSPP